MATMIWNSIVDHIPLWGWIVIFGVPSIVAMYYLSPILLPIWRMLPIPVQVFLGAAGAALLAYLGGRYKGAHDKEEEERRRNAEALQKRTEVNNAVDKLGNKEAEKQLRDRWTRPDAK